MRFNSKPIITVLGIAGALACHDSDTFHDYLHNTTPREAYQAGLEQAGLLETALGRDWVAAGLHAFDAPVLVDLPYRETGYLPADSAMALAFQFEARRGQRYVVALDVEGSANLRLFVDLFRAAQDSLDSPRHVSSGDSLAPGIEGEFHRNGAYVLRVQPELLRGGRYTLTIDVDASLAFPVEGKDSRAILSAFGASRDGGRREHQGVDIFAPRGTPVLAAAAGRITQVREAGLGGKVVWQLDRDRGQSLYYAHLDSQVVVPRQVVETGDTVGFVGNTGNARTTPPHLHFGIYRRGLGALDPWPFVHRPATTPAPIVADLSRVGQLARVTLDRAIIRHDARSNAGPLLVAERHTLMYIRAAMGGWYRVALPDGSVGYVDSEAVEVVDEAVGQRLLAGGIPVLQQPDLESPRVAVTDDDTIASVFGSFGDYQFVRLDGPIAGWVDGSAQLEAVAR
jgi:murein DD-endopeptidase MepM/ murein hydrolase activator NlpD